MQVRTNDPDKTQKDIVLRGNWNLFPREEKFTKKFFLGLPPTQKLPPFPLFDSSRPVGISTLAALHLRTPNHTLKSPGDRRHSDDP